MGLHFSYFVVDLHRKRNKMEIVTLELRDKKAYKLLQYLEELQLIKVLKNTHAEDETADDINIKPKYRGALHLSDEQYHDFQKHAQNIRGEWENNI